MKKKIKHIQGTDICEFCADINKNLDITDLNMVTLGDGWVLAEVHALLSDILVQEVSKLLYVGG